MNGLDRDRHRGAGASGRDAPASDRVASEQPSRLETRATLRTRLRWGEMAAQHTRSLRVCSQIQPAEP
jgi:hypothetical protein